jgi:1-acyl-sn-glycerol-3-phosphate acyltransferase
VLVYPGGDYETFRPSWHSDQIEFGGRQGFAKLALEENVPIVPVVAIGGQETALFLTRGERAAKLLRLDKLTRIKVLPVSIGPPLGINLLDLPGRIPLPAKITIQVLPRIDLRERYGTDVDVDDAYEQITTDMQDELTGLSEERTLPVVG